MNPLRDRRLPPVDWVGTLALVCVVAGGIWLVSVMPGGGSMVPGVALLIAGGVFLLTALAMLSRVRPFAWRTFRVVAGYGFLAYLVLASVVAFAFVLDDLTGAQMAVMFSMLGAFAVIVPLLLGFGVARYQER